MSTFCLAKFWTNPQYHIKLTDIESTRNKASIIIALMQKFSREKRLRNDGEAAEEFLQFRLFKVMYCIVQLCSHLIEKSYIQEKFTVKIRIN